MRRLPRGPVPGVDIKQLEKNLKAARKEYLKRIAKKDFDSKEAIEARRGVDRAFQALRKAKGI